MVTQHIFRHGAVIVNRRRINGKSLAKSDYAPQLAAKKKQSNGSGSAGM
jgi:hypothetical protein